MRPYHPPVHVELGLRERRTFPSRIVVQAQLDPREQHRTSHQGPEVLQLSPRVRLFVTANMTPSDNDDSR
jgi:hypothetical protein